MKGKGEGEKGGGDWAVIYLFFFLCTFFFFFFWPLKVELIMVGHYCG